jgi:hypothetical protein
MKIDWEGLIVGFESRSHQITHFFDRETGDVEQVLVREVGRHAEMTGNPRYIALPRDEGERSLGDLRDFLPHCQDAECRRRLQACLETDAAAAAYREILLSYPKEEAHFFQFKERRALTRAREWLAAQEITVGSSPDR